MSTWRYLTSDAVGAGEGLAYDEALMLHCGGAGAESHPTSLRLYTYRPHCALVGRYQNLEDEVDLDSCAANDIEIGRRPTGGGAIIMGPGQLGVALVERAPRDEAPRETLRRYAAGVVGGLEILGIKAGFRAKNDLEADGRKIAGLGLYRDPHGALLFHASVLVDLDVELMLGVLRIPGAKLSDKKVAQVGERVTTISRELRRELTAVEVRPAFAEGVAAAFGIVLQPGELDSAETERLAELASERYGNREWILQSSPRRDSTGSSMLKTPAGLVRIHVGVHGGVIKSALVSGDYNVPPSGVHRLEAALRWCKIEREDILHTAVSALQADDFGVEPMAVAEAVWQAAQRGMDRSADAHPHRTGSCYFPAVDASAIDETKARQEEKA
jgi:lipoate-protein ligase A